MKAAHKSVAKQSNPLGPVVVLASVFVSASAFAALTVSPIFGTNMVLQEGMTVPVFGTATPGATVTVQFAGQNVSAVAGANSNWVANLATMAASSSPSTMT